MLARLDQLNHNIPITVIGGSRSWMNFTTGKDDRTAEQIAAARPSSSYVGVHYVDDAGHHVHAQQSDQFNRIVNGVFKLVDSGEDLSPQALSSRTVTWSSYMTSTHMYISKIALSLIIVQTH